MADRIIVYWRDIPAQVIIKKGRTNAKRELSLRFTEAIDMCAMRSGASETDDYLAEWRKADPVPVSDDLEAEADKAAAAQAKADQKAAEARAKAQAQAEARASREAAKPARRSTRETPVEALTKSVLRTAGSTLTRELMRGLLGGLKRR